jgi:hypothetical protein
VCIMSFMRAVCLGFDDTDTLYDEPLSVHIRFFVVTNLSGVLIYKHADIHTQSIVQRKH